MRRFGWTLTVGVDHDREFAWRKALSYKQRKLDRAAGYTKRLEGALAKQKAQTADDQTYIDSLEAHLAPAVIDAIKQARAQARGGDRS
jgi:hypothetical protein